MGICKNYTGFAVCDRRRKTAVLVGCAYKDVGMYTPCLRLENGIAVALGIGGFTEESVNDPCRGGHYDVLVADTPEEICEIK